MASEFLNGVPMINKAQVFTSNITFTGTTFTIGNGTSSSYLQIYSSPTNPTAVSGSSYIFVDQYSDTMFMSGTSTKNFKFLNNAGTEQTGIGTNSFINIYNGIATAGIGTTAIYGTVDKRTDVTATDTSAVTIYTAPAAGTLYELTARVAGYSGTITSAIYTVKWTENGQTMTETCSISTLDSSNTIIEAIQPDSGTAITGQLTTLSGTTPAVNVSCYIKRIE